MKHCDDDPVDITDIEEAESDIDTAEEDMVR